MSEDLADVILAYQASDNALREAISNDSPLCKSWRDRIKAMNLDLETREDLENAVKHYWGMLKVDVNNLSIPLREEHMRNLEEDRIVMEEVLDNLEKVKQFGTSLN